MSPGPKAVSWPQDVQWWPHTTLSLYMGSPRRGPHLSPGPWKKAQGELYRADLPPGAPHEAITEARCMGCSAVTTLTDPSGRGQVANSGARSWVAGGGVQCLDRTGLLGPMSTTETERARSLPPIPALPHLETLTWCKMRGREVEPYREDNENHQNWNLISVVAICPHQGGVGGGVVAQQRGPSVVLSSITL